MILDPIWRDRRGEAAVEFGLTAPWFFLVLFGIVNAGFALWTQIGLQHGAEMAARCASINTTLCSNNDSIKSYAVTQALGLNPNPSIFTISPGDCGGTQVSAKYPYSIFGFVSWGGMPLVSVDISATSCSP